MQRAQPQVVQQQSERVLTARRTSLGTAAAAAAELRIFIKKNIESVCVTRLFWLSDQSLEGSQ